MRLLLTKSIIILIVSVLLLSSVSAVIFAAETQKSCPAGTKPVYQYRLKSAANITEDAAKETIRNFSLVPLTLGGSLAVDYFKNFFSKGEAPGTETLYDKQLIYCLDENKKPPCGSGTFGMYDEGGEGTGCASYPSLEKEIDFGSIQGYQTSIQIPCQPIAGGGCPSINTPAGYIARIYQFGLMIAGLVAFGSIIFGAIQYILSAGSIVNQGEAKDRITQAIVGLLLLLGAYLILYTINPDLVKLRNPSREIISIEKQEGGFTDTGTEQIISETARIPNCKLHDLSIFSGTFTSSGETQQLFGNNGGCRQCNDGFGPADGQYPTNECVALEGPLLESGSF